MYLATVIDCLPPAQFERSPAGGPGELPGQDAAPRR